MVRKRTVIFFGLFVLGGWRGSTFLRHMLLLQKCALTVCGIRLWSEVLTVFLCVVFSVQAPPRLRASSSSSLPSSTSASSLKTKSPWALSLRYRWGPEMCLPPFGHVSICSSLCCVMQTFFFCVLKLLSIADMFFFFPHSQATCFAALGISFMVMSLSFIIIDWTTGAGLSVGGH